MITDAPSNVRIFKRHLQEDEDETIMRPTLNPTINPTLNETPSVNYVCVCNTQKSDEEKKITALIIATSLSSFSCILLIFFIIWYRFIFKKKLMNKHQNNKLFLENFGIEGIDNDI